MNSIYYIFKKLQLAVLPVPGIGVPARTITTTDGCRTSAMALRATPVRIGRIMCVLFGLFNNLVIVIIVFVDAISLTITS